MIAKPYNFKTIHWKQCFFTPFLFDFTPFSRTRPYIHRLPGWWVCTHMWFTIAHSMNEHCYNKQPIWHSKTRVWHCKAPVSHCKALAWRCKAPSNSECLCEHTARRPEARNAYETIRLGTEQYVQSHMHRAWMHRACSDICKEQYVLSIKRYMHRAWSDICTEHEAIYAQSLKRYMYRAFRTTAYMSCQWWLFCI